MILNQVTWHLCLIISSLKLSVVLLLINTANRNRINYIVDCITTITESFVVLCEKYEIKLGVSNSNLTSVDHIKIKEWINTNWKTLSKCLKILLPRDIDESITQQLLNNFQAWINLSGSLKLLQIRDSFLNFLCNACLPKGMILTYYNILINQNRG